MSWKMIYHWLKLSQHEQAWGITEAVRRLEDSHAQSLWLGQNWTIGRAVSGAVQHFFTWCISYAIAIFQLLHICKARITELARWMRALPFLLLLLGNEALAVAATTQVTWFSLCIWQLKALISSCIFIRGKQRGKSSLLSLTYFTYLHSFLIPCFPWTFDILQQYHVDR